MSTDSALAKTLTLLLLIAIGFLLKKKFKDNEQVNGIKNIILNVALPATIFVALMGVKINASLLFMPLIALIFNFLLYFLTPSILKLFSIERQSPKGRTLMMLLPSLAPGLSSFPFILEYLGEEQLANAALADVGNKFFVLIFLYVMAMNWHFANHANDKSNAQSKLKSLLISLIKEPINIIILLAIGLLSLGLNLTTLPSFLSETFVRLSAIMTPLVLIFIGLAVKLSKKGLGTVISILCCRAGISILISAIIILALGLSVPGAIMLAVVFPLSACSFWPFAHMSAFNLKEEAHDIKLSKRTFDTEFAILILACSLPFSTLLILGILSAGTLFTGLPTLLTLAFILLGIGALPIIIKRSYLSLKSQTERKEGILMEQAD
jgi:predicted permease